MQELTNQKDSLIQNQLYFQNGKYLLQNRPKASQTIQRASSLDDDLKIDLMTKQEILDEFQSKSWQSVEDFALKGMTGSVKQSIERSKLYDVKISQIIQ